MKDHSETTESVAFDFLSYAEECILVVNQLVSIVEPQNCKSELERMTNCATGILDALKLPYRKYIIGKWLINLINDWIDL